MQTLYMNNDGSRWVILPRREHHSFLLICPDGTRKIRQADFFESFGNFATTHFRFCGKRYHRLFENFRDEKTDLPVIDMTPQGDIGW